MIPSPTRPKFTILALRPVRWITPLLEQLSYLVVAEHFGQLILPRRVTCLVPFLRVVCRTLTVLRGARVLARQWKLSAVMSLLGLTLERSS